jgi:hypothetical protein
MARHMAIRAESLIEDPNAGLIEMRDRGARTHAHARGRGARRAGEGQLHARRCENGA